MSTRPPLEFLLKLGEAVHSVVDGMNISLDFKIMLQSLHVFLDFFFFENWPSKENDVLCVLSMRHAPIESTV